MQILKLMLPTMPDTKQWRRFGMLVAAMLLTMLISAMVPSQALDLVTFASITGPLASALTQLATLTPAIKGMVVFLGFVVALISLAALRNFTPVLSYVGMAIFAAVGLVIAGAIVGAVV